MTNCQWKVACLVVALGALAAKPAAAQTGAYPTGPRTMVTAVSGYYDNAARDASHAAASSASDQAYQTQAVQNLNWGYRQQAYAAGQPVPEADGAAAAPSCDGGCNGGCNGSCGAGCGCGNGGCGNDGCSCASGRRSGMRGCLNCQESDPWRLFECLNDNCAGVQLYGWIDAGFTANFHNPTSSYNGPVSFNDRMGGQLNQAYMIAERTLSNCGCGWDWGGRVDVLYGTDSRFVEARGLETNDDLTNKWNGSAFYGIAVPQAYLEVGYNDLSVKLGHFYTIVGYESPMATSNFFYSHAYSFQYGEPFTHTGALANYKVNDRANVLLGIDRGWNNFEGAPQSDTIGFLGGVTWDNGSGTTLALTGTFGQEPSALAVGDDRWLISAVGSFDLTDRLTYVIQSDIARQESGVSATQDAEWYSVVNYLFYKINCCWTAGARFEWFRDDDGTRVNAIGGRNGGNPATGVPFQGDFFELTMGANWSPNDNIILRPEVRYDWFDQGSLNANEPYDDNVRDDQWLFAIDLILNY